MDISLFSHQQMRHSSHLNVELLQNTCLMYSSVLYNVLAQCLAAFFGIPDLLCLCPHVFVCSISSVKHCVEKKGTHSCRI